MKYLEMLKSEKGLPAQLPKLSKHPFGTFDSTKGSHVSENKLVEDRKPKRAKGYGCGACGNKIYQEAVKTWTTKELPEQSDKQSFAHWKCEGCGAIFEIIGGSKGPEYIN
jgi:hypothetical protein